MSARNLTELKAQLDLGLVSELEYDKLRVEIKERLEAAGKADEEEEEEEEAQVAPKDVKPMEDWIEGKKVVENANGEGVWVETEYKTNDMGRRTKVVRRMREKKVQVKVLKRVLARRGIPKFGLCKGQGAGLEDGITAYGDIVTFDIPQEKEKEGGEDTSQVAAAKTYTISCRACGAVGDHWTMACPYKDRLVDVDKLLTPQGEESTEGSLGSGAPGKYRPPARRGGGASMRGTRMDDALTIRVSNLSEEATDVDVRELFAPFGSLQRVFLAKDRRTGLSRGFAFVSYYSKRDAEDAMATLHGHGYANLILSLEWAAPSKKPGQ